MKRILFLILSICIFALSACGEKADPIVLPEASDITSIDVIVGQDRVTYTDENWISEIICDLSAAESTNKASIQDIPQVESYITISIQPVTGTSTLFIYEENEKYYVEQPYQGIYEIDSQLYERLQENK